LLIRATLADALGPGNAKTLLDICNTLTVMDSRNLVALSLSNFAFTVKKREPALYKEILDVLMKPYEKEIRDTVQFLYITGNAGLEREVGRVIQIALNDAYLEEAMYALRNIESVDAVDAIENYLENYRGREDIFETLLSNRAPGEAFYGNIQKKIVAADETGDTTRAAALRFILDNAWPRQITIDKLRAHKFKTRIYREEMDDFIRQSMLCDN
jgi:hypothetical protein